MFHNIFLEALLNETKFNYKVYNFIILQTNAHEYYFKQKI